MLLRHRAGEPSPEQLAVNNPNSTPYTHRREIDDAIKYLDGEAWRARKTGSKALLSMTGQLLDGLNARQDWRKASRKMYQPESRRDMEIARRKVMSALGVTMLLRMEGEGLPAMVPRDIQDGELELATMLDLVSDERPHVAVREESRVHVPIVANSVLPEDGGDQWCREGNLWVRQVRPAEPTTFMTDVFLPGKGITPDFTHHETLYPFIAAK